MTAYLTHDYYSRSLSFTLIFKPYGQGLTNLQRAMPRHVSLNPHKQRPHKCAHLIVGLILLIPIINSLVLLILHRICQYQLKKSATILQKNFRGFSTRKRLRLERLKPKPSFRTRISNMAKKAWNSLKHPTTIKALDRVTGIRLHPAYDSLCSSILAINVLRDFNLRLFAVFAMMSIGNAINAIFHIFIPRDARELGKING